MNTRVDKAYKDKSKAIVHTAEMKGAKGSTFQFVDNRAQSTSHQSIHGIATSSDPIQLARWRADGGGKWKLVGGFTTAEIETGATSPPPFRYNQNDIGRIYNTSTSQWEAAAAAAAASADEENEEIDDSRISRGHRSGGGNKQGRFIGVDGKIHIHLVGSNDHLQIGVKRTDLDINDPKSLKKALEDLQRFGRKGVPGYTACLTWLKKMIGDDGIVGGGGGGDPGSGSDSDNPDSSNSGSDDDDDDL